MSGAAASPAMRLPAALSPRQEAWRRLRSNRFAITGGIIIALVVVLAIVGPALMALYSGATFDGQDLEHRLADPTHAHPLGTDIQIGRAHV